MGVFNSSWHLSCQLLSRKELAEFGETQSQREGLSVGNSKFLKSEEIGEDSIDHAHVNSLLTRIDNIISCARCCQYYSSTIFNRALYHKRDFTNHDDFTTSVTNNLY